MGSPPTNPSSSVDQPPIKPNPFRPSAVIATVFGAIGTGATIVGGGILMSFHKLTVDDEHTRRAAGISTVVVGAVMIPPTLIIGVWDAYRYWKWRQWMKAHSHQSSGGVVEMNNAPHAPSQPPPVINHNNSAATETTLTASEPHTVSYEYADEHEHQPNNNSTMHMTTIPNNNHTANVAPIQLTQIVTVS